LPARRASCSANDRSDNRPSQTDHRASRFGCPGRFASRVTVSRRQAGRISRRVPGCQSSREPGSRRSTKTSRATRSDR
jgi:hypothetical protein